MKFSIGGHTETQAVKELDGKGRNGKRHRSSEAKVDGVCSPMTRRSALVERESDGSYSVAWKVSVL